MNTCNNCKGEGQVEKNIHRGEEGMMIEMDVMVVCDECEGDGISRCNNPDHGFIQCIGGDIGRLGCPVCGHDEYYRVRHWNAKENKYEWEKCDTCNGTGEIINPDYISPKP